MTRIMGVGGKGRVYTYGGSGLVANLCLTLCDLMDYSPPASVHGIFQARIL